jgi:hypothetical protein
MKAKPIDYGPLLSLIAALLAIGGTVILAVRGQQIPPILVTIDAAASTAIFVTSAARGTEPPGGGKK